MSLNVLSQVAYQNDPEGALIQFASPEEAKRAMQSTEAVLNNRFIRVNWFHEDGSDVQGKSLSQQTQPLTAMVKVPYISLNKHPSLLCIIPILISVGHHKLF